MEDHRVSDLSFRLRQFSSYFWMVLCTVLPGILLFCVWAIVSSNRPVDYHDLHRVSEFFELLGLALTFGAMIWLPIVITALMPGFYVFRLVGSLCLSFSFHRRIVVGLASFTVPLVGTVGMMFVVYIFSGGTIPEEGDPLPLMIFLFGVLPSFVMGQFIYVH